MDYDSSDSSQYEYQIFAKDGPAISYKSGPEIFLFKFPLHEICK